MRIAHLSFSDCRGGAAIGAYRLHRAMLDTGLDSHMLVMHKGHREPEIHQLLDNRNRGNHVSSVEFSQKLRSLYKIPELPIRSFNLHGTDTADIINRFRPDIVQMHWIGLNTIRIDDIGNIRAPVVWKMPDMWAFSGAEHYSNADVPQRHREGYDRVPSFRGEAMDIDRLVWEYKRVHYRRIASLTMVSPSRFLAIEAHRSILLGDRNCHVIPNPLPRDYMVLEPITQFEKNRLCEQLGVSGKQLVVFFGAFQTSERRKGFHYIEDMIEHHLPDIMHRDDLAFVVAGGSEQETRYINGYEVRIHPTTSDFRQYVSYLRSCDLLILPSEMENSAMVIQEALACGIPAVVFSVGGMPDLVHHRKSGYLAQPYNTGELAEGIKWWLECTDKEAVRDYARRLARSAHDPVRCARRYTRLYQEILESTRTGRSVSEGRLFDRDAGCFVSDKPARLLIIAPSVSDWTGTSSETGLALAIHARASATGIAPEVLGDRECTAKPGFDIDRVFDYRACANQAPGNDSQDNRAQADSRLVEHMAGVLGEIVSNKGLNARDALFFPMPDRVQVDSILILVAALDHPDFPCLHVNVMPETTADSRLLQGMLRALRNTGYVGRRIFLYTGTEAMVKQLCATTGLDFALLDTSEHGSVSHSGQDGTGNSRLIDSIHNQGLAKNETILYVGRDPAMPEPVQWREQHGSKVIFLATRDSGYADQAGNGQYPQPGEPFFLNLTARPGSNGTWTLPPIISHLLESGKLKHVVFEKDVPSPLRDTLEAVYKESTGNGATNVDTAGLFMEADPSRHETSWSDMSSRQAGASKHSLLIRLPRAVLRRVKNVVCSLCRR